jgi:hypothetical protein
MNARKLLAIAGFVTLTLAGAGAVQAQEDVAADLELVRTTIKTSNGGTFKYIDGTLDLFSPTTVTCPVPFCVLRVELSTQFKGEIPGTPPSFGVAGIEIDGTPDGLQPTSYGVFADGPANAWSSQAFAIMKDGVSNGNHTVTVSFWAGPAKVILNGVTLTVQVFKPMVRKK